MVDAVELPRGSLALAAHHRAAVAAGIQEDASLPLPVAAEDDRAAGHMAGLEVARLADLRGMPDVNPALAEDALDLPVQDLVGDEDLPVDQELGLFLILDDMMAVLHAGADSVCAAQAGPAPS